MVQKKEQVINTVREYVKKISKYVEIDKVILFGSRARGDARESSDIDLIIISRDFEGKKFFERPRGFYLAWGDNYEKYEIDIICLTPEEFEMKRKQIGVVMDAVKEGIEI